MKKIKNQVQLITYPDSLGGNLKKLSRVLQQFFPGMFSGIHILPPFPSSGDRGFAPITYLEIEPSFGTWEDIKHIGERYDVMLDLMVNHISRRSVYFKDFERKGRKSKYADLFITLDKIWPDRNPTQEEIEKIFLRRNEPFSRYTIQETGEVETVWTSFGKATPSEQIDIDVHSPATRELFREFLENFSKNRVSMVRLDAVGYVIKKPGTSCFFVKPEIYHFLDWIRELAHSLNIELLPEIHAHYTIQFEVAKRGFWIYDFILPYTVLEALITGSSSRLVKYLKMRPSNQFTMLDCHDGVPIIPDLNDLVDTADARKVVEICLQRGANLSRVFSPKHRAPDGFDVHQIRGTYYSLLNCDDDAYLTARAIQFFTPGIPQVYYVGLLAGENDIESAGSILDGREINRHNFTLPEIEQSISKPVVQRLFKLIRFRNEYPAFAGTFQIMDGEEHTVNLRWEKNGKMCRLAVDLKSKTAIIEYVDDRGALSQFVI